MTKSEKDIKLGRAIIAGHVTALGEAFDRYTSDGWRLAFSVKSYLDPTESEAHRQAVEDAADVLEYFNPDGFMMADADEATVLSAIAALDAQVRAVVDSSAQPPGLEMRRVRYGTRGQEAIILGPSKGSKRP